MAEPGDVIHGLDGEKLIFHQTASTTEGVLLEMEVTDKPNSGRPPAHYHPSQEEHFQVPDGAISTWIDGREQVYQPGGNFAIPANTPHAMHNSSDEVGRVMWQVRPAQDTEALFEALWGLARDGKLVQMEFRICYKSRCSSKHLIRRSALLGRHTLFKKSCLASLRLLVDWPDTRATTRDPLCSPGGSCRIPGTILGES